MRRPRELSRTVALFPARTPTLPPATHTNSYALGARDVLLVEPATPYADEQRAWIEWARGLPSAGRRPVAILLTHHHVDHVSGADVLSRELSLPLWAHADTASRVEVRVDRLLADGDAIDLAAPVPSRWRVLHTPGHAPGHVCLHDEDEGTLVVGDMVASVGTILIAPGDGDMAVYLAQLERLASLGATVALPAHGEPIDEPTALFRHYVAHRLGRERKVLAAVAAGGPEGATAEELVPVAYDDVPPTTWPVALLSLQSHLAKLVAEGRVRTAAGAREHAPRYSAA
ncbi:MAG TPA: MBL fold metallo-hydrolase [Polyangiaceae bacterium]|nr:MBL fold metallo-hydrolase [Polyangiaceae bacterium]